MSKSGLSLTITLPKIAWYGRRRVYTPELTLELRPAHWHEGKRTINLEPAPMGLLELSICGQVWNSKRSDYIAFGKIVDDLVSYFPKSAELQRIAAIWKRWHLNGLKPGTRRQQAALDAYKATLSAGRVFAQKLEPRLGRIAKAF